MHKLKGIAVTVIGLIVMLLLFEEAVPTVRGTTVGLLRIAWVTIKTLFLQDWILSVALFIVGSLAAYGTIHLSRRKENKVWSIVTGIVSITSYITMFSHCSGGN